ncbi:MAG: DNA-3-methyladenine glycosylase [Planctomycetales bacterium]|nr:DNA-3-methyladenine glycosylase [Planctomycetales bacterium]
MPIIADRLTESFYDRPTAMVARDLIGKALLHYVDHCWVGGWIVETEAYLDRRDPASHSARGQTPGNASMFAKPGTLYVYPIHAKYCMNAVTEPIGRGAAVLIRAIDPVWGIDSMQRERGHQDLRRLTRGPSMLCQSLRIGRSDDNRCLVADPSLGIFSDQTATTRRVAVTKRIGITKAVHRNLRFIDVDSNFLSRPTAKSTSR